MTCINKMNVLYFIGKCLNGSEYVQKFEYEDGMRKHPKFSGKHITPEEHEVCVRRLRKLYPKYIEPVLEGTDLYDRARWYRGRDAPCVFIFRDSDIYETEERSIFFHIQNTGDENGIQIVFRKNKNFSPLPANEWAKLGPDRWDPYKDERKAITVRSEEEIAEARRLIDLAIVRYDQEFGV